MVYEVTELKDGRMKINCSGALFGSSIEDFDVCMARVIDKLLSERKVTSVVMAETRENEYGPEQTKMLVQIAAAINRIVMEEKIISDENVDKSVSGKFFEKWKSWLYTLVSVQLRGDPIGGYLDIEREIRHIKIILKRTGNEKERKALEHYLSAVLEPIKTILEKTDLIKNAQPFLTGYHIGDRSVYRKLFHPIIRPNFMLTKFVLKPPAGGEIIDKYNVGGTRVEIFRVPGKVRSIYQITPPEFVLSEEEYTVLDDSRKALEERKPQEFEVRDQEKMRDIFHSISLELLRDIASLRRFNFSQEKLEELAQILTRYTTGLGVLELLLADSKIQDIHINSPLGEQPLFILHQEFEECETNIIPTKEDGERWSTRFKLLSGRPLDEANPVLDTEISVPGGVARVAAIGPRVSPEGLAFAFRRHRFEPWTFPLFIQNKFFDPLSAGLLWFFTTYGRTLLVAGTRGSGKTSLLGSLMLQVIPYYRIITVEDTYELPIEALRKLSYNVERMKSRSVITKVELELSAEEAIRTALRMGDSCLFIGEVRSREAIALYEAMRIGALANVVAGTIHGESAYGVFERVVNDLGVPATSFKATDLIVVANKIRSADGLRSFRRVTEITEVRKHWQRDPAEEHGFMNLLEYNTRTDSLKPTDTLLTGESQILNDIAKRVPGWAGRWDSVWDNIQLRAKVLQEIVRTAELTGKPALLEAPTVVSSNQAFHRFSETVRQEVGSVEADRVFNLWQIWFREQAKKA